MVNWKYIRFCPYCQEYKEYVSKHSKNNKTRCEDCKVTIRPNKKTFHCQSCNGFQKFKTNDIKEFFEHSIICGGVK